jgi:hypothetical protein
MGKTRRAERVTKLRESIEAARGERQCQSHPLGASVGDNIGGGGVGPGAHLAAAAARPGRTRKRAPLVFDDSDDEPPPSTRRKQQRRQRSPTPPRARRPADGQAACSSRTVLPPLNISPVDGHDDYCVVCHYNCKLLMFKKWQRHAVNVTLIQSASPDLSTRSPRSPIHWGPLLSDRKRLCLFANPRDSLPRSGAAVELSFSKIKAGEPRQAAAARHAAC